MVWFQKHARLNSPYSGYGRQFGAPGGSYEPESPIRRLTKDAYAQAKQGQVAAALSLLEQYEATYRNELDFWKCYIHCLSKLCWQDHSNFAQDEAWCALFEQRMQRPSMPGEGGPGRGMRPPHEGGMPPMGGGMMPGEGGTRRNLVR